MTTLNTLTPVNHLPIANQEPMQINSASASTVASVQESSIDDFCVVGNPVSMDAVFSPDGDDDEWAMFDKPAAEKDVPAPRQDTPTKFLASNAGLNNRLSQELSSHPNKPEAFFGFIAKNTNPNRISYLFQNIFSAISNFLTGKKLDTVVERNCVHCTQAVDKTLAQFCSNRATENPDLFQVGEPGRGEFLHITSTSGSKEQFRSLTHKSDALSVLKEAVLNTDDSPSTDPKDATSNHKRACFSIPVRGQPHSHAMNYVHYDDNKEFVICGQTGTVYDLSRAQDRNLFNSYYGVAESEGRPRVLQVLVTGEAPKELPIQSLDPNLNHLKV